MSEPLDTTESRGRSLDVAMGDAWTFGGGLLVYWLTPGTPWWSRLISVAVVGCGGYGLRRLYSRRHRARGVYSAEVHRPGATLQVSGDNPHTVADVVRRWTASQDTEGRG